MQYGLGLYSLLPKGLEVHMSIPTFIHTFLGVVDILVCI